MRTNGDKRRRKARLKLDLAMELRLIDDLRPHAGLDAGRGTGLAARWRRRPDRVFWEVQPTGGRRLV